jgi:hypothetical protein
LQRLATHGFLAACYENTNTGAGSQGVQALDSALSTFPDLADHKFGSTGHSQGGQAAFTVLALAEKKYGFGDWIYAGLAMEPASGFGTQPVGATWQQLYAAIVSPMFMFSGLGTDGLVSQAWVQQAYGDEQDGGGVLLDGQRRDAHSGSERSSRRSPSHGSLTTRRQTGVRLLKAIPQTHNVWAEVTSKNIAVSVTSGVPRRLACAALPVFHGRSTGPPAERSAERSRVGKPTR